MTKEFPWNSPYAFAENDVVRSIDLEGREKLIITVRAFIPYNEVALDITHIGDLFPSQPAVHGDGARKFIYDLEAAGYGEEGNEGYRVEYVINLDLDKKAGDNPVTGRSYRTGETSLFLLDQYGGRSTLWKGYAGDEEVEYEIDASPLTDDNGQRTTNLRFTTSALVPIAYMKDVFPAIDLSINIALTRNNSSCDISCEGTAFLDGFPAIEMFLTNEDTGETRLIFGDSPNSPDDGINLMPFIGDKEIDLKTGRTFEWIYGPAMGGWKEFEGPTREEQEQKTAGKDEF